MFCLNENEKILSLTFHFERNILNTFQIKIIIIFKWRPYRSSIFKFLYQLFSLIPIIKSKQRGYRQRQDPRVSKKSKNLSSKSSTIFISISNQLKLHKLHDKIQTRKIAKGQRPEISRKLLGLGAQGVTEEELCGLREMEGEWGGLRN